MPNEITMSIYQDTLMHYGILGMHWGVRRYQPYGEGGYDPDHKGRNVGLAARLAGGGSSYSSIYGRGAPRGSSPLSRNGGINVGPSDTARKISRGINEGLERLNYANDRLGQGIKNAGKKARSALNEYSGTVKMPTGKLRLQEEVDRVARYDTKTALQQAALTFKANARTSVNNIKHTSKDDIMRMIGDGSDRFKSAVSKTAVKSKEFGRNAALAASLLAGALDPTSSASQIVESRSKAGVQNRSTGATVTTRNPIEGLKHPTLRRLDERFDPTSTSPNATYYMSEGSIFKPKSRDYATSQDANRAYAGGYLGGAHSTYDRTVSRLNERDVNFARKTLLSALDNPAKPNTADAIKSKEILDKAISEHKSLDQTLDALHKKYTLDPYQYGYLVAQLNKGKNTAAVYEANKTGSGNNRGMWVSSTDLGRRLLGL